MSRVLCLMSMCAVVASDFFLVPTTDIPDGDYSSWTFSIGSYFRITSYTITASKRSTFCGGSQSVQLSFEYDYDGNYFSKALILNDGVPYTSSVNLPLPYPRSATSSFFVVVANNNLNCDLDITVTVYYTPTSAPVPCTTVNSCDQAANVCVARDAKSYSTCTNTQYTCPDGCMGHVVAVTPVPTRSTPVPNPASVWFTAQACGGSSCRTSHEYEANVCTPVYDLCGSNSAPIFYAYATQSNAHSYQVTAYSQAGCSSSSNLGTFSLTCDCVEYAAGFYGELVCSSTPTPPASSSSSSPPLLVILLAAGGGLLVLVAGGAVAVWFYFFRKPTDHEAEHLINDAASLATRN